jgi:hypothetical protein
MNYYFPAPAPLSLDASTVTVVPAGAERGVYWFEAHVDGVSVGGAGYAARGARPAFPGALEHEWEGASAMRLKRLVGAAHPSLRLTRLVAWLALQRETLMTVAHANPSLMLAAASTDRFVSTVYTCEPESKGLRGLMRLADRRKDPVEGYRLVYCAPLGESSTSVVFANWISEERRRERAQA